MFIFKLETFSENLYREMLPIIEESFKEVYVNQMTGLGDELKVDKDYYHSLQNSGNLKAYTIRNGDKLIGYYVLFIYKHQHSSNIIIANCENIHILKEFRKMNISNWFISNCENSLKKCGISLLKFGVGVNKKSSQRFLKMAGFKEEETIYVKEL